MTRAKSTRTIFHRLGDIAIVVFLLLIACIATEALRDYRERMAEAERLQNVHTDGMAIGAALCEKESRR